MEIEEVKQFCETFYRRFSTFPLRGFQLKLFTTEDSSSLALVRKNESEDIEAVITATDDSIRIIKIKSFDELLTVFTFDTPLELFTNLLTLTLVCCNASGELISPEEALTVTLGNKVTTWRELIIKICSLAPEDEQILVQENHENAVKLLKTVFLIQDSYLLTKGMYNSQTHYNDILELIRAVLDALSALFRVHDIIIDPFFKLEDPQFSPEAAPVPSAIPPGGAGMPPPMDMSGGVPEIPVAPSGEEPPVPGSMDYASEGFPGGTSSPPGQAPVPQSFQHDLSGLSSYLKSNVQLVKTASEFESLLSMLTKSNRFTGLIGDDPKKDYETLIPGWENADTKYQDNLKLNYSYERFYKGMFPSVQRSLEAIYTGSYAWVCSTDGALTGIFLGTPEQRVLTGQSYGG